MWEPGPFPKAVMKRVQRLEGNSVCMDCGQAETSWGGPTYGILLCVKCAGRHRSLGTHLTVIKSLTMDRWDAGQVRRMELGGNGQLRAWFKKCQTENSALEMKYRTKAATLYRENLRAAAEDDLASGASGGWAGGEESARSRSPEQAPVSRMGKDKGKGKGKGKVKGRIFAAAERAAAESLAREAAEAEAAAKKLRKRSKGSRSRRRQAELDGNTAAVSPPGSSAVDNRTRRSSSAYTHGVPAAAVGGTASAAVSGIGVEMGEQARRCGKDEEYEVVFGPGGMGFTLMKDAVSRALVTRLAPGGMAFRLGVRTGDYLVGVDGARLYDYDQLMLLLPRAPRPLRLLFEGAGAALAASPSSSSSSKRPAVPLSGKLGADGASRVGDGNSSDSSSSSSRNNSSGSSSGSGSSSSGSSSDSSSSGSDSSSSSNSSSTSNSDDDAEIARNRNSGQVNTGRTDQVSPHPGLLPAKGSEGSGEEGAKPLQDGHRPRAEGLVTESPKGVDTNGNGHASAAATATGASSASTAIAENHTQRDDRTTSEGRDERDRDDGDGGTDIHTTGPSAQDDGDGDGHDLRDAETAPVVSVDGAAEEAATRASPVGEAPRESGSGHEKEDGVSGKAVPLERTTEEGAQEEVGTGPTARVDVDGTVDGTVDVEQSEIGAEGTSRLVGPRPDTEDEDKGEDENEVGQEGDGEGEGDDCGDETVSLSASSVGSRKTNTKARKSGKSADKKSAGKSKKNGTSSSSSSSSPSSVKPEPGLSVGSKVTVQDKKGSKWRKGLLRRMHGDGSWTVRYSGGMEERRVATDRMRLRVAEESSAAAAASLPVAAAVTGTEPTRSPASRGATGSAVGERGSELGGEGRGRARKGKKTKKRDQDSKEQEKEKPTGKEQRRLKSGDNGAAGGGGAGGDRNVAGWKQPASAPLAWVSTDGTKGREGEFRAPGELGDEFFGDSGSGSDSSGAAVSALTAYARLDPTTAATAVPRAFAHPAVAAPPAPTYAAGYTAPRRMEGFGGGGSGWRSGGVGGPTARGMGPGAPSLSTGGSGLAQRPMQSREHTVIFPEGGMGLTLTKELDGGCSVTKIVHGGVAHSRGVALGQRVCAVNGQPSGSYEQTMAIISGSSRPISITFVMPANGSGSGKFSGVGGGPPLVQQTWADVGLAATIGAMDAANAVAVEWGLGTRTPGVLDGVQSSVGSIPPPPQGFRVHQKHSLMAIPTGVAGGFGNSLAKHRTFAVDVSPDIPTMSTKKALSDSPGEEAGEFDVSFQEGELGMRLEERGSFQASSVVVRITEDGQAMYLGVREGCTVVGINGEKYLSHAHTVATLKHAKRPVQVRFRASEGGGGGRRR
eukprot:g11203.t1